MQGTEIERISVKPGFVRATSRWLQDVFDRKWRDEHELRNTKPMEQSRLGLTLVYDDVSKSLSKAEGSALGAFK